MGYDVNEDQFKNIVYWKGKKVCQDHLLTEDTINNDVYR